jgi:hypothetical protein
MKTRRGRARLISEYVDARLGRRTRADAPEATGQDRDFDELLDLARELSRLEFEPPRGAERAVLQRLAREAARMDEAPAATGWWPAWFGRQAEQDRRPLWQPLLTTALALLVLGSTLWLGNLEAPLTAGDLLARVDRLDAMVSPGEVLHRTVRAGFRTSPAGAAGMQITVQEWLDGSGSRSAAAGYDDTGRPIWLQVHVLKGAMAGSRMYLYPTSLHPQGIVVERPSAREFADALAREPAAVREAIEPILRRRQIVTEPIWSDRWENRLLLGVESREPRPEESVDIAPWTTPEGRRGYRLRLVDRLRPWIEWRGPALSGVPAVFERVRYVDARGYLTLRETAEYRLPDGRVFAYEREVLGSQRLPLDAGAEARFQLDVPLGTPVRRASAQEELLALAEALLPPVTPTHPEENVR